MSIGEFLDIQHSEIEKNGKPPEVASSVANVLQEYLSSHQHIIEDH